MPGHAGRQPAYTLHGGGAGEMPILLAVPHAGRAYPEALLGDLREAGQASVRLEDRFVDILARGVAEATGVDLLLAHAPRAMIDLNRAPEDVDCGMVERMPGERVAGASRGVLSPRARSGLGLIPRRLPGIGELWRRSLRREEVEARIAQVHAPYHAALAQRLAEIRARWGVALLVDLHSMPPLQAQPGQTSAEIVIGDRFGASCHGAVIAATFAHFARCGRAVAHNRPYAGGYVLDRHAAPRRGIHALQVEIDRTCYLDAQMRTPSAGVDVLVEQLAGLVRAQAAAVMELARPRGAEEGGEDWPLAAQ